MGLELAMVLGLGKVPELGLDLGLRKVPEPGLVLDLGIELGLKQKLPLRIPRFKKKGTDSKMRFFCSFCSSPE